MTETTEEKVKRIVMNQEGLKILDMIKGDFHDCIAELAGHGVSTKTIATLVNAHTSLTEEIQVTIAQVTSLTREIDGLKDDVTKRMEVADIICKENRDLKSLLSKAEKENKELKCNSEYFYIDPEDPYLEERSSLELAASMVSFNGGPIVELQKYAKTRLPNVFIIRHGCERKAFTTKEEALSSLNKSKGVEE